MNNKYLQRVFAVAFCVLFCWLLVMVGQTAQAKETRPYTAYHSYISLDGVVTLRKYRFPITKHYNNPFVGKKIVSIKKKDASDEQNYWIAETLKQCGSLDAVLMVEAESGWVLDSVGETGDRSLFQWSPIWQEPSFMRHPDFWTWKFQVREGCKKFNALANVNKVYWNKKWKDWRSLEGGYWHGLANAYNPKVLERFEIVTK